MRMLPIIAALMAAVPVQAATLKTVTTLHGPNVYLRDLFDDAGANADRLLGPGPGPGGRIVVGAAQLGAIARQFDVDWRPVSSADRAVLEWPGRALPRDDVLEAVRSAVVGAGASDDCVIELPGFTAPIVPMESAPKPVVAQLDYDAPSGRFTATLSISGEGTPPFAMRIGGHVDDTVELPVATTRLGSGTVLRTDDVHMVRVRTTLVHGEVAHTPGEAVGMQLRRQIVPGMPIALRDLSRPTSVQRGATLLMQLQAGGLEVSGQGIALESGAVGERIRVQTAGNRSVIEAEIIGPGRVRVVPNTGAVLIGAAANAAVLR